MKKLWTPSRRSLIIGAPALLLASQLPAWGGRSGSPWSNYDGSGGINVPALSGLITQPMPAPRGATPQHPTYLSTAPNATAGPYLVRPPWSVAGIDYAVGIDRVSFPLDINLTDPNTIFIASGDLQVINANSNWQISGTTNHVLNGIDFSKPGPNGVYYSISLLSTATWIIFQNCKFGFATTQSLGNAAATSDVQNFMVNQASSSTCNVAFINCVFDGGNPCFNQLVTCQLNGSPVSQIIFLYCWMKNFGYGVMVPEPNLSNLNAYWSLLYRYCLVERNSRYYLGHLNTLEFPGCGPWVVPDVQFNTVYQEPTTASAGEFMQFYLGVNAGPGSPCRSTNSPICNFNTMIATSVGSDATAWAATTTYNMGQSVTGASLAGHGANYYVASPAQRVPGATYAVGVSIVLPSAAITGGGNPGTDYYICTTGGTVTGGLAPVGYSSTKDGQTVTDGTAVFTGKFAYRTFTSGGSAPNLSSVADGASSTTIQDGTVTWVGRSKCVSSMLHGPDQPASFWTTMNGIGQCANNYVDLSGVASSMYYHDTFSGWFINNNIDMNTGLPHTYPG